MDEWTQPDAPEVEEQPDEPVEMPDSTDPGSVAAPEPVEMPDSTDPGSVAQDATPEPPSVAQEGPEQMSLPEPPSTPATQQKGTQGADDLHSALASIQFTLDRIEEKLSQMGGYDY